MDFCVYFMTQIIRISLSQLILKFPIFHLATIRGVFGNYYVVYLFRLFALWLKQLGINAMFHCVHLLDKYSLNWVLYIDHLLLTISSNETQIVGVNLQNVDLIIFYIWFCVIIQCWVPLSPIIMKHYGWGENLLVLFSITAV